MGWMQELYKTYEKSKSLVGVEDNKGHILLPVAHSTQNAQIEIAIDLKGEFKSARSVEKAEAVTIIPVTEDSGNRTSGIAAHPLFDKLCYIAGDFSEYCVKKNGEEYHQAYMDQIGKWYHAGCHDYVRAIYLYVQKDSMVRDLADAGTLVLNEGGLLDEHTKIQGIAQSDAFVRFRIQDAAVPGRGEVWKKQEVYGDYVRFYLSQLGEPELDYVTGEYTLCSDKQPSKIRNSADKAKLISSNDSSGFTYRGRFADKDEVLSIGYLSSQEAHNALKWLIGRQAYRKYGMCVLTWNPEDRELPDLFGGDDEWDDCSLESVKKLDVGEHYAAELHRAISGRYPVLQEPDADIMVMSLDAATPGRLSIVYYQHMLGSDFLYRLVHWYTTVTWKLGYRKDRGNLPGTPQPEDIVRAAFGKERSGLIHMDDRLMKGTLERLIPCIIEGKPIPLDIVKAAVENASRPQAFGGYNRRKVLDIACALIHKKYKDMGREEFDSMSLNRKNGDRDYLYGRLLAVAHKLEYDTYADEERGKRDTNAVRFTSMMVKNPPRVWMEIERRLIPYRKKLSPGLQVKYQIEFQEIYDLFKGDEFSDKRKLGEQYLLGYNCELSALWESGKKNEE